MDTIFKTLIDTHTSGILLENSQRIITVCNQSFLDMFDLDLEPRDLQGLDCKHMGQDMENLFLKPTEFTQRITLLLKHKQKTLNDIIYLVNGKIYQRDYIPIITPPDNYQGHYWVYRDITTQTKMYTYLENSAKNNQYIIANLSHEIINPLSCIIELTEIIAHENTNKNITNDIILVQKTAHHILEILQTLIQKKTVQYTLFNIQECITDICNTIKIHAKKKHIQFQYTFDLQFPPLYTSKQIYIHQIISNLLGNAIKYTHTGHIKIHTQTYHKKKQNHNNRHRNRHIQRKSLQNL
ncbi:putative sensory box histidine kinase/response protein [Mimivirus AB-566-O17]|uniref:Putative sensory box histidine kinase/response protein n=1 Tax=Mimivirus AB-566-O17 TaxID=1988039 RepID=A0A1X9VNU6_9VIRU|nr:putative sensory box histidine kinase/response protein [Mimivirus AB-566-O17]